MATKPLKVRTAREPSPNDTQYIIVAGAPRHYVSGYGLVGPGAFVSLAEGVKPGKYMAEVTAKEKAAVDSESDDRLAESKARELAESKGEALAKAQEKPATGKKAE